MTTCTEIIAKYSPHAQQRMSERLKCDVKTNQAYLLKSYKYALQQRIFNSYTRQYQIDNIFVYIGTKFSKHIIITTMLDDRIHLVKTAIHFDTNQKDTDIVQVAYRKVLENA
jgi:hypothetical protein